MHRNPLRQLLATYPVTYPDDTIHLEKIRRFVNEYSTCFERSLSIGHITGSAWIVDPNRSQALLTYHRKLNRWLQLGGHADGDPNVFNVALREAQEESGLKEIVPLSTEIFDLDVHLIPSTPTEPTHYHYDVRFIFQADPTVPLVISNESKDLAWVNVVEIHQFGVDRAISRMIDKMNVLKS